MQIQDLAAEESEALLKRSRVGHVACSQASQPYVTPFSFAYDGTYIYSFATVGRKIAALRANPLICIAVEEIVDFQQWKSVLVFGHYQEMPDTAEFRSSLEAAHDLLSKSAEWWEPGYAKTVHEGVVRPLEVVWFRVLIHEITGHQAIPNIRTQEDGEDAFALGGAIGRFWKNLARPFKRDL